MKTLRHQSFSNNVSSPRTPQSNMSLASMKKRLSLLQIYVQGTTQKIQPFIEKEFPSQKVIRNSQQRMSSSILTKINPTNQKKLKKYPSMELFKGLLQKSGSKKSFYESGQNKFTNSQRGHFKSISMLPQFKQNIITSQVTLDISPEKDDKYQKRADINLNPFITGLTNIYQSDEKVKRENIQRVIYDKILND